MHRLILTLMLLAATTVHASLEEFDALSRIGAQLEQHALIRADFSQSKQIAALKKPLVTTGRVAFSRRFGVLWMIERPYRMSYVLGENRVAEIGANGMRRERSVRDTPGLTQVGRIFRALLGANAAELRDHFAISVHGDTTRWEIRLRPRAAQLAQFLSGLTLSGGRFVETIRIDEAGGDTTLIRFNNTTTADAPNETELSLYGDSMQP